MEKIKNNKELTIILGIVIVVLIVAVVSAILPNKSQYIGKWEEVIDKDKIGELDEYTSMEVIELYEGGIGQITSKRIIESYSSYPTDITWEIKDNTLIIDSESSSYSKSVYRTYKLKNNLLISVKGQRTYKKVK